MLNRIYFLITIAVLVSASLITGVLIYKNENKKGYSFLNSFPFEMDNHNNFWLAVIFRVLTACAFVLTGIYGLYLFYFPTISSLMTKVIGCLLLLNGILGFSLFLVNMRVYRGHIAVSSVFFVVNMAVYFLFGYLAVRNPEIYFQGSGIASFILAGLLLIAILSPFFLSWAQGTDKETEKRKKFNILAFSEWLQILAFFLFAVLITFAFC